MSFKKFWKVTKESFSDFGQSRIFKKSAALAYYTIFSLPAILIIVIWITESIYGTGVRGAVYRQIEQLIGAQAASDVQQAVQNAALSGDSYIATIIGLVTLIIGATTVFAEIQDSINSIWRLKTKPRKGRGILRLVINRLLSFSMVITLGFLMLVSLLINSFIDIFMDRLSDRFPQVHIVLVYIVNILITFLITSMLFAVIFKFLPDANIKWKQVRTGAMVTSLLFIAGKFGINFYIGQTDISSIYGTAGSLILILLWVYYSSAILYFGAVVTKVWAVESGHRIHPSKYAVWVEEKEVSPSKSSPPKKRAP